MGVGFGINWGPICQLLMEFGSPEDRARTSAMLPTLQAAGFALGAAIFGLVANAAGLSAEIDAQLREERDQRSEDDAPLPPTRAGLIPTEGKMESEADADGGESDLVSRTMEMVPERPENRSANSRA